MARASRFTQQRVNVLKAIVGAAQQHTKTPTVRELADQFVVSTATMHSWLSRLQEEGLVQWTPRSHRSLHCTPAGFQLLSSQGEPSA